MRSVLRNTITAAALALLIAVLIQRSLAQTYTVLHSLNGGSDGGGTDSGLVADRQGNLYGVGYEGGLQNCPYGCGTVFRLSHRDTGWIFSVLYRFTGGSDGWWPNQVVVASDGSLYGTTGLGGSSDGRGYGTVFRLQPPATFCAAATCPWRKTTLYIFDKFSDGHFPYGPSVDAAGNLYGTSNEGGENGAGNVWELSPSNGGWTFKVLYAFQREFGGNPLNGVAIDAAGNLWGSGNGGNVNCGPQQLWDCGLIWELVRSDSGWYLEGVYGLDRTTGGDPVGILSFDPAGNLYGTLAGSGPKGNGGIFQFVPSTGQFTLLYAAQGNINADYGPQGGVAIDQAGNLYAADPYNGAYGVGYVFKLTPSNGDWIFTDLHDFDYRNGGYSPYGPLVVGAQGNAYGAAGNDLFEITP